MIFDVFEAFCADYCRLSTLLQKLKTKNQRPFIMELLFLGLRGWQLIIVVLAIVLLFGANKIPDLMRNLGRGVHSFRQGVEDAKAEINKEVKKATDIDTDAKQ